MTGKLVLFSEGAIHWTSYRPIIRECLHRDINFAYLTLDAADPALAIESSLISKKVFKRSFLSYLRLSQMKGDLVLTTTPHIGTKGYPLRRSPYIRELIHFFHAFSDTCFYKLGALDCYDTVFLAGPQEEANQRKVERERNLPSKKLLPGGLPYLDDLQERLAQSGRDDTGTASEGSILVAPSWGEKNFLNLLGLDFIKRLALAGHRIIIRPHPYSRFQEPRKLAHWRDALADYKAVSWDESVNPLDSMKRAALLISDNSSIRYDFAFSFERPVITVSAEELNRQLFEVKYHDACWFEETAHKIGVVVRASNELDLVADVNRLLSSPPRRALSALRDASIYNRMGSAKAIIDYIEASL